MTLRRRTGVVLALAVLLLAGAAIGGLVLLQQERATSESGSAARSTWDAYDPLKRALVVHASVSPCQDVDTVEAVETGERIEVTVVLSGVADGCADPAVELRRRVGLDRPLGDRAVYDAGCLADGGTDDECLRSELLAAVDG